MQRRSQFAGQSLSKGIHRPKKSMHVGISAMHIVPGKSGSHEPYLVNLIRGLAQLSFSNTITIFGTERNKELFRIADGRFEFVSYPDALQYTPARIFFEQFIIPLEARRRHIDVFHFAGTASSYFVRPCDVVTIHFDSVTQRDSISAWHKLYYDLALRINRRAGLLITPSKSYGRELAALFHYREEQIRVVYHGVNSRFRHVSAERREEARRLWRLPDKFILTVANLRPHKNVPALLRAFSILLGRHEQDIFLVIVGNVDADALRQMVAGVTPNWEEVCAHIKLIPFVSNDSLPPIYSLARVFVFVSRVETFGLPLVEAMASGLPIIASNIAVHREILGEHAGLLVSYDEPEAIAGAIHYVLTKPIAYDIMKDASLARSEEFSWVKSAYATLRVYEEAFARVSRRR